MSTLATVIHTYEPTVDSWWIGLYKLMDNTWIWEQSSDVAVTTNWEIGQPNGTSGESCVVLARDGKYKWDDVDCNLQAYNGLKIAPVCQDCRPEEWCEVATTLPDTTTMQPTSRTSSIPWPDDCTLNTDWRCLSLFVATCLLH